MVSGPAVLCLRCEGRGVEAGRSGWRALRWERQRCRMHTKAVGRLEHQADAERREGRSALPTHICAFSRQHACLSLPPGGGCLGLCLAWACLWVSCAVLCCAVLCCAWHSQAVMMKGGGGMRCPGAGRRARRAGERQQAAGTDRLPKQRIAFHHNSVAAWCRHLCPHPLISTCRGLDDLCHWQHPPAPCPNLPALLWRRAAAAVQPRRRSFRDLHRGTAAAASASIAAAAPVAALLLPVAAPVLPLLSTHACDRPCTR